MDANKIQLTEEVIQAINEELEYQNNMHNTDRANTSDNGLAGQVVTLQHYAQDAITSWTLSNNDTPCLNNMRKIAATAIRALIRFGCPRREL